MADRQEIYNTVKTGLLAQNQKSADEKGWCYYRSGENNRLRCAAGFLIPDDRYLPSFEGLAPHAIDFFKNNYSPDEIQFIEGIQMIHDWSVPAQWPYELERFARRHNLTP